VANVPDVGKIIAAASALIVIMSATIYILGFVTLALSIYIRISRKIDTSLYAVSLIPRTVVVGLGLSTFFTYVLVPLMLTTLLIGLYVYWVSAFPAMTNPDFGGVVLSTAVITAGVYVVTLLVPLSRYRAHGHRRNAEDVEQRNVEGVGFKGAGVDLGPPFLASGVGVVLWALAAGFLYKAINVASSQDTGYLGLMLIGATLFFAGSFLLGVAPVAMITPPLVQVEIEYQLDEAMLESGSPQQGQTDEARKQSPEVVKGKLLAHSDSFWHFFDGTDHRLTSIPDGKIRTVKLEGPQPEERVTWWRKLFGT